MKDIDEIRRANLRLIEQECGSPTAAAQKIGMSLAQFSNLRDGAKDSQTGKARGMRKDTARRIELSVGKQGGWLDVDHSTPNNSSAAYPRTSEVEMPAYGAVPIYHAPDAVLVPVLANRASMGPGADLLESDVIVGDLALSPHWINQYIRPQNPRELRFIHAYGDSMAPTFTDGDVLLVDTGLGARDPHTREGVYVLQADGKNYVKRVTPTFDGKLQVTSDNPSSKTVQVLNGDHQVDVVGRVVWAWNGKKL